MKKPMEYWKYQKEKGAVGYIILWAMGVPISVLLLFYFVHAAFSSR